MITFCLFAAIVFFIMGIIWNMSDGLNFLLKAIFLGMAVWGIACYIVQMTHG